VLQPRAREPRGAPNGYSSASGRRLIPYLSLSLSVCVVYTWVRSRDG